MKRVELNVEVCPDCPWYGEGLVGAFAGWCCKSERDIEDAEIPEWCGLSDAGERVEVGELVELCDSLLLLSGYYLRKGIKVGIVRDCCDDLLEIRTELVKWRDDNG